MRTLEQITIKGFKSIREQTLELASLNVFIGGNGVGKSNLIGAFQFLHEVIHKRLAKYAATRGGADSVLHFGRKTTQRLEFLLEFDRGGEASSYHLEIEGTDDSGLVISKELASGMPCGRKRRGDLADGALTQPPEESARSNAASGDKAGYSGESRLREGDITSEQVLANLTDCRIYHFHDTGDTAAMKGIGDVEDNRHLRPQAENLAAFLYYLQERKPDHFRLIEDTIRQIAPFFGGFQLAPRRLDESTVRLEWHEEGHDGYFNATSLSDGTLRFICLATLLLQPDLPAVILLDEPELGLHPAAIALLADLLTAASEKSQLLVATQSVTLINHLIPDQVWTVNREGDQSVFLRLNQSHFSTWLEDYSLGELWEKNLIGARP